VAIEASGFYEDRHYQYVPAGGAGGEKRERSAITPKIKATCTTTTEDWLY